MVESGMVGPLSEEEDVYTEASETQPRVVETKAEKKRQNAVSRARKAGTAFGNNGNKVGENGRGAFCLFSSAFVSTTLGWVSEASV